MKKTYGFLATLIAFSLCYSPTAFAQTDISLCPRSTDGWNFGTLCNLQPGNALPGFLTLVLIAAVALALLYLMWGGIKWITSGGDKANVETARNHIVAVVVGLILVFLAWFIINLLLNLFFGRGLSDSGGSLSIPRIFPQSQPTLTPAISPIPTPLPISPSPTPCPTDQEGNIICAEPPTEIPETQLETLD